jgi:hypothetical protein
MIPANETFNSTWPFKPHFSNALASNNTRSTKELFEGIGVPVNEDMTELHAMEESQAVQLLTDLPEALLIATTSGEIVFFNKLNIG